VVSITKKEMHSRDTTVLIDLKFLATCMFNKACQWFLASKCNGSNKGIKAWGNILHYHYVTEFWKMAPNYAFIFSHFYINSTMLSKIFLNFGWTSELKLFKTSKNTF